VFAASFGPEVVKEKASEDVERLSSVRVAASVVALKVRGVVLLFEDSFPQKDEGQVMERWLGASHSSQV
jgi:hypothetical protein